MAYVNSKLGAVNLVNVEALPPGVSAQALPQCAAAAAGAGCFDYSPYLSSLSGSQNPYSPQWTFNAGLQYVLNLGGSSTLTPRINYSYIGSQWTTLFESYPTDYLRSYGLWSSTITYEHKEWQVQLYGMNLANKIYVSGQLAPGSNPDNEFFGNPRQFGVRVSRSF